MSSLFTIQNNYFVLRPIFDHACSIRIRNSKIFVKQRNASWVYYTLRYRYFFLKNAYMEIKTYLTVKFANCVAYKT